MEESCQSMCQSKLNGRRSLSEKGERTVLFIHFPAESQRLAQLSRVVESKVKISPVVNALGERIS